MVESGNVESFFDMSRSLIFAWFDFYFFESRNMLSRSLGLGFLTRISASRRVSNFTIRHPYTISILALLRIEQESFSRKVEVDEREAGEDNLGA